jgi:alkanesulfonate monooxygenase SsuD/methylene tetrahydromethanopterin reductase-like flavin-dependent oxidoreductase (luciferase family)
MRETVALAKAAVALRFPSFWQSEGHHSRSAIVRKVAIAGTPAQVVQGLKEFLGTGLKLAILWEIVGPDRRHSLELIAHGVITKLC